MTSRTKVRRCLWSTLIACTLIIGFSINPVHAGDPTSNSVATAWDALRSGTAVALMRHALAPGTGDPDAFDVNDCATQRNLSDLGRAQAQAIGDLLRENDVSVATVLTSQWCRCVETAKLLNIGNPEEASFLNSFFADRSTESEQTRALERYIRSSIATHKAPVVLVTHQVNISALTRQYASSGDMLIVTYGETTEVLAQISTAAD